MGSRNKMLVDWYGKPMVRWVVEALREGGLEPIVIVGHEAEEVVIAAGCRSVFNPRYAEGMGTSLACGAEACDPDSGILVALGDMPEMLPSVVGSIVAAYECPDQILAPFYAEDEDHFGHPILFGAAYRRELSELTGDAGGKSILKVHAHRMTLIPCQGGLRDYDYA